MSRDDDEQHADDRPDDGTSLQGSPPLAPLLTRTWIDLTIDRGAIHSVGGRV